MTQSVSTVQRLSTGVPGLDEHLGGGLLPGTLTILVGSTGIGKTQFGLSFANAGLQQEGRRGIIFDMNCRGDSQNHANYARDLYEWPMQVASSDAHVELGGFFDPARTEGDYLRIFTAVGQRIHRRELDFDEYQRWHAELARKLSRTIAFFYGNFTRGVRRAVIDGIEPVERASDSIQMELFEYIDHQILRKDYDWLARDLFRQEFRHHAAEVEQHAYKTSELGSMFLATSHENMLDALISRPLDEGNLVATANTLIYLGKIRDGLKFRRAMYIAKHRGSKCSEEMIPYEIDDGGLRVVSA